MSNFMRRITYTLTIIGALNWGLVGFLDFNLVSYLFGDMTVLSRTIYAIIGISSVYAMFANHQFVRTHCYIDD